MDGPEPKTRGRGRERAAMTAAIVVILVLFVLFFRDIMIPFLRLELSRDLTGAQELLRDRGALGFFTVTLVEALQMVVVFIPAEFIQISSGLSYPFYVALPLCDLGVCLGASVIFLLVRVFRYHSTAFEKRRRRIDRLSAAVHERNTVLFMYLLFFMPIIPFGAICYYGSSTKLSYGKYIRTVATGVIPSIVVSNLMGAAGMAFLVRDLPLWLLVVVIVLLAAALFFVIYLFLDRFCFKESDGTPDSPMYAIIFFLVRLWHGRRPRPVIEDALLREAEPPYVLLANHESFFDFYYIYQMEHHHNPTFLVNEFYCTRPVLKTMAKKAGILSKKLFTTDMSSSVRLMRTVRRGTSVVLFPEGRLSPDGRSNPIVEEGGAFYKKLGADLVLVKLRGAYFNGPKWRKKRFREPVRVTVEQVIKKDELQSMTAEALNERIASVLYNDASENDVAVYRQRNKAVGLENLLYRCADCGGLYTTESRGNELYCTACGRVHALDEHYRFTSGPPTIPAWYDRIRAMEEAGLSDLRLRTAVRTKIFGADGGPIRWEDGECELTPAAFTYRSGARSFTVPTERLPALAFSCSEEFELYHADELHYFYPTENRRQTVRWALAVDLLTEHRKAEGTHG